MGPAKRGNAYGIRPERLRELIIATAMLVSAACGVALVVVYLRGGNPQVEGVLLAVALGAPAIGLGIWAHWFMPPGGVSEALPDIDSTPEERAAFAAAFDRTERTLSRRRLLVRLTGMAVVALAAAAVMPLRSLGPRPLGRLRSTAWARGRRVVDENNRPVRRDDLDVGSVVTVFPEGFTENQVADSQTVLIRLRVGELQVRPGRETWSPDGFVAYSRVCTHAGCPVGLYQSQLQQLVCPCHQSLFDVTDGARPVAGPAARSLPQLPLAIDGDGYLVAQSDYREPIGPGFWSFGK